MLSQKITNNIRNIALGIGCCILPFSSFAHSEINGSSILSGMLHPISGPDHLLAMLSVGMISTVMGGRNIWLIPSAFVSAMIVGGLLGIAGIPVPFAEVGIGISSLILGLAIAFISKGFSTVLTFAFVFCFGIFHGNTHGLEMPKMATPFFYTIGFLLVTIFIHIVGLFLGEVASDNRYSRTMLSIIGGGVTLAGLYFTVRAV